MNTSDYYSGPGVQFNGIQGPMGGTESAPSYSELDIRKLQLDSQIDFYAGLLEWRPTVNLPIDGLSATLEGLREQRSQLDAA